MSTELLDPGAQAERTALAWQRTGLTVIAVGALLVRTSDGRPAAEVAGALLILAGAFACAVVGPLRYRRILRSVRAGGSPVAPAIIAALTVVVCVVLVVATAVVVA